MPFFTACMRFLYSSLQSSVTSKPTRRPSSSTARTSGLRWGCGGDFKDFTCQPRWAMTVSVASHSVRDRSGALARVLPQRQSFASFFSSSLISPILFPFAGLSHLARAPGIVFLRPRPAARARLGTWPAVADSAWADIVEVARRDRFAHRVRSPRHLETPAVLLSTLMRQRTTEACQSQYARSVYRPANRPILLGLNFVALFAMCACATQAQTQGETINKGMQKNSRDGDELHRECQITLHQHRISIGVFLRHQCRSSILQTKQFPTSKIGKI